MTQVQLQQMAADEKAGFREMVERYWRELMPEADILQDSAQRDAYFEQRFRFDDAEGQPYWAVVGGQRVGFLRVVIVKSEKRAVVQDFYLRPEERRKGYGSVLVRALCQQLDAYGVQRKRRSINVLSGRGRGYGTGSLGRVDARLPWLLQLGHH
jgi:GNAT superfamily N-acetyltransferase